VDENLDYQLKKTMNENLLQYAWQCRLFVEHDLKSDDGLPLEVIDVGQLNQDAGPDFFNAKIRVGDTIWAGNVEIHSSASDWYRHHHEEDPRYDSIILHVVGRSDVRIYRKDGEPIPQVQLILKSEVEDRFRQLEEGREWVRCASLWRGISSEFLRFQFSRMVYERVSRKAAEINKLLIGSQNDWQSAFYQTLVKGFGMHTNALPFEMLAKSLPFRALQKQRECRQEVEALLFGQAGLLHHELESHEADPYVVSLKKNYIHLQKKYGLEPIDGTLWKFSKMRPSNFPEVRIAQLAALICEEEHLFSKLIESDNVETLQSLLRCTPSEYWDTHYRLGKSSVWKLKQLDGTSLANLLINVVIPMKFAYAERIGDADAQEIALSLLELIPEEKNSIVKGWDEFFKQKSVDKEGSCAYRSQALIELKSRYCDRNDCLRCPFGSRFLQSDF
jgi:hypothetical protein